MGGAFRGAQKGGLGGAVQGAWDAGSNSLKTDFNDMRAGANQMHNGVGQVFGGAFGALGRSAAAPLTTLYGAATGYGTAQDPNMNGYGINATPKPQQPAPQRDAGQPALGRSPARAGHRRHPRLH